MGSLAMGLLQRDEAKGMAEGMAKGRTEGMAESLLKLLDIRFGPVPGFVEHRINAADISELDYLLGRVCLVPSICAMFYDCRGDGMWIPDALSPTLPTVQLEQVDSVMFTLELAWLQEGEDRGLAKSLLKILERRLGPVPSPMEKKIYDADNSELDYMLDKACVIPSIDLLYKGYRNDDRSVPEVSNFARWHTRNQGIRKVPMGAMARECFEEGETKGMARSVLKVLDARFGPVHSTVEKRIYAADKSELDRLLGNASLIPSLEVLFNCFDGHDRLAPEARGPFLSALHVKWIRDVTDALAVAWRQEGRNDGMAEVLLKVLNSRFGTIPDTVEKRIYAADYAKLDMLLHWATMATFSSLSDLLNFCRVDDKLASDAPNSACRHPRIHNRQRNPMGTLEKTYYQEGYELGLAMARATPCARQQAGQDAESFIIHAKDLFEDLSETQAIFITFAPPEQMRVWFIHLKDGAHPKDILDVLMPLDSAIKGWKRHKASKKRYRLA